MAIVGPSGAGKSTVFQLLLRYYDAQAGRILLDGVAVRDLALEALRGRIGIVPQDAVIFSGSAMDNIRYGKPDASDDESWPPRGAFCARLHQRLPEGYATFLASAACACPAGSVSASPSPAPCSRTRRCYCWMKPPVLGRKRTHGAGRAGKRDGGTHHVGHRAPLGHGAKADHIVVLDHGRIVEQGTHADLVAQGACMRAGGAAVQCVVSARVMTAFAQSVQSNG